MPKSNTRFHHKLHKKYFPTQSLLTHAHTNHIYTSLRLFIHSTKGRKNKEKEKLIKPNGWEVQLDPPLGRFESFFKFRSF